MRLLLPSALLIGIAAPVAPAASSPRAISTAGVQIVVPAGWHAVVSKTPSCDPERLIVASSAAVQIRASGRLAAPDRTDVLVLLLEDRYLHDRPTGDLRRPKHFSIAWSHLRHLDGGDACGFPNAPMFMRYVEARGRYLGFIVYPGARVGAATRAKTLALMDSLRVGA